MKQSHSCTSQSIVDLHQIFHIPAIHGRLNDTPRAPRPIRNKGLRLAFDRADTRWNLGYRRVLVDLGREESEHSALKKPLLSSAGAQVRRIPDAVGVGPAGDCA